jgi:phage terminase large subunit-like protein
MNALAKDVQASVLDHRFIYPHRVAMGVDLGQSHDPTSIAVVEQIKPTLPDEIAANMQR